MKVDSKIRHQMAPAEQPTKGCVPTSISCLYGISRTLTMRNKSNGHLQALLQLSSAAALCQAPDHETSSGFNSARAGKYFVSFSEKEMHKHHMSINYTSLTRKRAVTYEYNNCKERD